MTTEVLESPSTHLVPLPRGWALWRTLVLRGAGFPAEVLWRLAAPASAAAADEWLRRQDEERAAASALQAALANLQLRPEWQARDRRRLLVKALRTLAKGKLPREVEDPVCAAACAALRETRTASETAKAALGEAWTAESYRLSREIEQIASDERLQEAMTWQNRHAVEISFGILARRGVVPGHLENQHRRSAELLVASYLQRYCAKNDTIGFFGPVGYGELVDAGPAAVARPRSEMLDRREVFFENWCIDALAQKLAADPALRPWFAPRLKASLHLASNGFLLQPAGKPIELLPAEERLLAACDGRRTARSLARELLTDLSLALTSEAEVYSLLEDLRRRRIVTWTLEVPLELYPDRTLEEQLQRIEKEDLRAAALSSLAELRRGREAVARAAGNAPALSLALRALEETFTRQTGLPPRHHQGRMYAARELVYEDCRRAVDARFGPDLVSRLGPPLSLLLRGARWLAGEMTRRVEAVLRSILGDLRRRSGCDAVDSQAFFTQALGSLFLTKERDACFVESEAVYQKRWAQVLQWAAAERESPVRFSAEELEDRCADAFGNPGPAWSLARYFSPDVLIAADGPAALSQGQYQIVLGEMHAGNTMLYSCLAVHHPDRDGLMRSLEADAGQRLWVLPQLPKQVWTQRLNLDLELSGVLRFQYTDEPPGGPRSQVLRAGDVLIEETDQGIQGRTRDGETRFAAIDLFSYYLIQECSAVAGAILPPRPRMPRIEIGSVVVARERWRLSAAELGWADIGDRMERFLALRRWARRLALPRFCFYKLSSEKKPCYLDLDSPIYTDLFVRQVRGARSSSPAESLVLTEMLPRIDQAWLSDIQERRYTSELRLVAREDDRSRGEA
jgi:lantibiotic biosynthesis dehydratase-like protein